MFDKFDFTATSKKERLIKAGIFGFIAAIVLGFLYGYLVVNLNIRFEFSIFFVLLGYGIGYTVSHFGRGVTKEFSILAAILAIICILVADLTLIIQSFNHPPFFSMSIMDGLKYLFTQYYIDPIIALVSGQSIWNNGMFFLFRILAVSVAAQNAKAVSR